MEKLEKIERICRVLIDAEESAPSIEDWLSGRASAARMILEIAEEGDKR